MTTSQVRTDHGGRVARIVLEGEHDVSTAQELSRLLLDCCREPVEVVVVDVGPCTFADSTVLGALVGGYKRITSRNGRLVVINANGALEKLLSITGLDELLSAPADFDPESALST